MGSEIRIQPLLSERMEFLCKYREILDMKECFELGVKG